MSWSNPEQKRHACAGSVNEPSAVAIRALAASLYVGTLRSDRNGSLAIGLPAFAEQDTR